MYMYVGLAPIKGHLKLTPLYLMQDDPNLTDEEYLATIHGLARIVGEGVITSRERCLEFQTIILNPVYSPTVHENFVKNLTSYLNKIKLQLPVPLLLQVCVCVCVCDCVVYSDNSCTYMCRYNVHVHCTCTYKILCIFLGKLLAIWRVVGTQ